MRTVDELITEALSLPSASRVLLVEKLIESLEFDVDTTIQTLWITEAKQQGIWADREDIDIPDLQQLRQEWERF